MRSISSQLSDILKAPLWFFHHSAMAMFVFFPEPQGHGSFATDLLSLAHDRDRGGSCCGGDRRLFGCCALSSEKELTDWWLVCAISILEGTRV